MSDVISWVRGEAGTTVVVTARTGATGTTRDVSMVRADVAIDPVSWTLVPGTKTALIRLDQFSAGAADDLKAVLGEVRTAGADRLILDLRGNPGGYVNEADAVASQFLKSGLVFIERGADGKETKHEVQPGGLATDLPLVVLVDAGTASSSEIVTGRAPGRRPGADRRGQDLRHRDGPRRIPAVGQLGPAGRHGRVAHARRVVASGTRASPPTSSSSAPATSPRSSPTRSAR